LVATPQIEDALYQLPEVQLAVAYGEGEPGHAEPVATVMSEQPLDAARITRACGELRAHERPRWVRRVASIPLTEGYRPIKAKLQDEAASEVLDQLRYDPASERYA
jgi:acyl-CoA synthetase (AMP-forming)/AMP-acid ligase II